MNKLLILSLLVVFALSNRLSIREDLQSKEIQINKNCDSSAVFTNTDVNVLPNCIATLTQYKFSAIGKSVGNVFIKNLGIQVLYNGRQLITFNKEISTQIQSNEEFSYSYIAVTPASIIAGQYTIYLRLYDENNKSLSCISLKFNW